MKNFLHNLFGWFIMLALSFAAVVSPEGLNIAVEGAPWLSTVAHFIGNLIPTFAILAILVSALFVTVAIVNDEFINTAATTIIKQKHYDLEKVKNAVKVRPVKISIAILYWVLIIGSGWMFSGLLMVIGGLLSLTYQSMLRQFINDIVENDPTPDELKKLVNRCLEED